MTTRAIDQQRASWRASAPGWDRWTDYNHATLRPVAEWLCDAVGAAPGLHVLDIAAGTGLPSLELARRVAPGGHVLATDLSPEMLEGTVRRARDAGLEPLETRVMDAGALELPDAAFDAATNSFGLMFSPDPARALAEMRRVLRPGGRAALAVWDGPERNPFFTTLGQATALSLTSTPQGPDAPGPFRFAASAALAAALETAGFRDVRVEAVTGTFECASPEQYWEIAYDHAGGMHARYEALPDADRSRVRDAAIAGAARFARDGRPSFPWASWCAVAVR